MATYYKYAERSADSQINWAEIGRDMSDMLKEENRIREEKKAAIDAASREFGKTLANPPQGQHKGANQWALEYADNASKFMLMQDKLLKSGQMKLKDYTVARQNILDGTDNAFNLTKEYQGVFAEKMERYKTDKSQDLEQWLMGQVEGYSDFNKSQLYINPTDGTLSVAMKEKKIVDGKEVFVMNKNPNQFTSISTLKNQIAGKYDKFDTNSATDIFVKGLGQEVTSAISKAASLSSGGIIKSIEDIRNRKEIDPATQKILYQFSDSENQFIKSTLVNPYDRLSVLTNSQKFAPNGAQYTFTNDAAEAKANPNKILLKVDPSSGQPTPQFSDEQIKVSEDFMRTELRAKYTRKEEVKQTSQNQLQERRAPTTGEIDEKNKKDDAKIFGENLATALTGKDPVAIANAISYLANKSQKLVDRTGTSITISNTDGTNSSTYDFTKINDPKKLTKAMISAFGSNLPEETIVSIANNMIGNNPLETKTSASGFAPKATKISPVQAYNDQVDNLIGKNPTAYLKANKDGFASELNKVAGKLGYTVKTSIGRDRVYLVDKDGKESDTTFEVTDSQKKNGETLRKIADFIKSDLAGASPEEKETNASSKLQTLGVTKPGGVGAKYN